MTLTLFKGEHHACLKSDGVLYLRCGPVAWVPLTLYAKAFFQVEQVGRKGA